MGIANAARLIVEEVGRHGGSLLCGKLAENGLNVVAFQSGQELCALLITGLAKGCCKRV